MCQEALCILTKESVVSHNMLQWEKKTVKDHLDIEP